MTCSKSGDSALTLSGSVATTVRLERGAEVLKHFCIAINTVFLATGAGHSGRAMLTLGKGTGRNQLKMGGRFIE